MAYVQDRGPPSAAAVAIGSAIISGLAGYFLGQGKSIGLFGSSPKSTPTARDVKENDKESDSGSESEGPDLQELKSFPSNEECKLVLVVRTDLGMGKGKHTTTYRFRLLPSASSV